MSEVGLFSAIDHHEDDAQHDMRIRGERLARFRQQTEGKVWQEQENGEWWLVDVIRVTA